MMYVYRFIRILMIIHWIAKKKKNSVYVCTPYLLRIICEVGEIYYQDKDNVYTPHRRLNVVLYVLPVLWFGKNQLVW